jgi:predicted O-linked N-acetylglucosamine transferase (SPINDLY family)
MRQGIPIVTLAGDQPHSRTDLWFFALSQSLPKWLIAQNEEEYVDIAIRLIENDDERVKISQDLLQENFDKVFLDAGYEHHKEQEKDFVNFMWWLYEHHDEIQKDGKKAWVLSEIEALNA